MTIRSATRGECARLPEIEKQAGQLFQTLDMGYVSEMPPNPLEVFEQAKEKGNLWVALDVANLCGFILVECRDHIGHIKELSVLPSSGRKGIGRGLITQAEGWAKAEECPWLSLSTFRDVPWNRPFYEKLGFAVCDPAILGPAHVKDAENGKRLFPKHPRVIMRKAIE